MANPNPKRENLEPGKWKKGQSGNPKGRPKGDSIATVLRKLLTAETKIEDAAVMGRKLTRYEALMLTLIQKGSKGDIQAIREVCDRLEGKPQQNIGVVDPQNVQPYMEQVMEIMKERDG